MKHHNYFTYILTNATSRVLYTGVTNDLRTRLLQHKTDALGDRKTFAGRYHCYHLVYWERHSDINYAIAREKEIKGWTRAKKDALILSMNPNLRFLEDGLED